jgi:tetratricopeptide (TPR) repeat protein
MSQQLEQRLASLEATLLVNSKDAWTHVRIGYVQLQLGRDGDAFQSFTKVMTLDPKLPDGPHGQGEVLLFRKDWSAALASFAKALELNRHHLPTLASLVRLHEDQGKPELATPHYASILEAKPDDESWQRRAAFHHFGRQNHSEALRLLERLGATFANDDEVTEAKGVCLSRLQRWTEVVQVLELHCAKPSATSLARLTLAAAYEKLGNFAAALPHWRWVHGTDASNVGVALSVARCCVELAQYREALDVLGRLQSPSQQATLVEYGSEPYWLEARAHLGISDHSAAARVATRGLPMAPTGESRLHLLAGEALLELERFDEATNYLEKATRYSPDDLRAWVLLGRANAKLGRFDAARRAFERATGLAPADASIHIIRANFEQSHGEPSRALDAFVRASELSPKSSEAALGAARSAFCLDELEKSLHWLRVVLAIDPALPEAVKLSGMVQFKLGRYDQALAPLSSATTFLPKDPEIWSTLAECHRRVGNDQREYETRERAFELDPSPEIALPLAIIARKLRCYERVVEVLAPIATTNPRDARMPYELGLALEQLGRIPEARTALDAACKADPSEAKRHSDLGRLCLHSGDPNAALTALEHANRLDATSPDTRAFLGRAYHQVGLLSEAKQVFSELNRIWPGNADTLYALSQVLAESKDTEDAAHYLDKVLAIEPKHTDAMVLRGQIALRLEQPEDALRFFRAAELERPQAPDVLVGVIEATTRANRYDEAVLAARRYLRIRPEDTECLCQLARNLEKLGRDDEATQAWRDALRQSPESPEIQLQLGLVLHKRGQYTDAERSLTSALKGGAGVASHWALLADCHERLGSLDEAAKALGQSVELEPDSAERCNRLGHLELTLGREPNALKYLTRAFELGFADEQLSPTLARLHVNQADRHVYAEQHTAALASLLSAQRHAPSSPDVPFRLGTVYQRLGREPEAIEALEQAEKNGNRSTPCLLLLAQLAARQLRFELAQRSYHAVLRAEPSNLQALDGHIQSLVSLGRATEAVADLTRAVELRPGNPDYHTHLGALLCADGRLEAALPHLTQAAELKHRSATAYHALADCQFALHRDADGVESLRHALALDPTQLEWPHQLIAALRRLDRQEEAIEVMLPLFKSNRLDSKETEFLALSLVRFERHEEAIAPLKSAATNGSRSDLERHLLECYWTLGRADDVIACAESLLEREPGNLVALELAAKSHAQADTPDGLERAILLYERLLGAEPTRKEAATEIVSLRKRRAELNIGNAAPDVVLADITRALELQPNDANLLYRRAQCLSYLVRPAQALEDVSRSLEIDANQVEAWLLRAKLETNSDRLADARRSYEQARRLAPEDPRVLWLLSEALRGLELRGPAAELLEELTRLVPDELGYRKAAADVALQLSSKSDAARHLAALGKLRALDPDELRTLSFLEAELDNHADAAAHFMQFLAANPTDTAAMRMLATCLVRSKRDPEAIDWLERLLRLEKDDAESLRQLGLAYERAERHEAAVKALTSARQLGADDAELLTTLHHSLSVLRRGRECMEVLSALARLEPTNFRHFDAMAELSLELGDDAGAVTHLEQSVELGSGDRAMTQLFDLLVEQADQSSAKDDRQAATALLLKASRYTGEEPQRRLACARRLHAMGNLDVARELAERARARQDTFETNLLLGSIWLDQARPVEATAYFERALAQRVDSVAALLGVGQAQLSLGNLEVAESALKRAKHLSPSDASVDIALGDVLIRRGDVEGAIPVYDRVLTSRPDDQAIRVKLAGLLERQQRYEECIAKLTGGPKATDLSEEAASILLAAYEATARWHDAVELCQLRLVAGAPREIWLPHLGKALTESQQYEDAVKIYEDALSLTPEDLRLKERLTALCGILGRQRLDAGDAARAAHWFQLALGNGQPPSTLLRDAALSYFLCKDLHRAQALAETLTREDPSTESWLLLGRIEADLGRNEQARRAFESAVTTDAHSAAAWFGLGETLSRLAQKAEALAAAREASKLQPDATHLAFLAALLAEASETTELARTLEQLERLRPLTFAERIGQARNYVALASLPAAITAYEDALELSPNDVDALAELGTTLLRSDRADQATRVLMKAQRLRPDSRALGEQVAFAQFAAKDFESALVSATGALGDPPTEALLRLIARCNEALGRSREAAEALERLVAHGEQSVESLLALGLAHARSGARDAAISALARAHAGSQGVLGGVELLDLRLAAAEEAKAQGNREESVLQLDQALPLITEDVNALERVARLLTELQLKRRALDVLLAFGGKTALPTSALELMAELHVELQQWQEAHDCFEKLDGLRTDDFRTLVGLGHARVQLGQHARAVAPLLRALSLRTDDHHVLRLLLDCAAQEMNLDVREHSLESMLRLLPRNAAVRLALARLELERQHYARVIELLTESAGVDQASSECLLVLASAQDALGRDQDCLGSCRKILELEPGHAKALQLMGLVQSRVGDITNAISTLDEAYSRNGSPDIGEKLCHLHLLRSQLLEENGDFNGAAAHAHRALKLRRGDGSLRRRLARLEAAEGRESDAVNTLREDLTRAPEALDSWLQLGDLGVAMGRPELAAEAFAIAHELSPRNEAITAKCGLALWRNGQDTPALTLLEPLGDSAKQAADVLEALAILQLRAGNEREGYAYLERLRAVRALTKDQQRALGLYLAKTGKSASAFELLLALANTENADFDVYYCLGQLATALGNATETVRALRQAQRLKPDRTDVALLLGETLMSDGQSASAMAEFERALANGSPSLPTLELIAACALRLGNRDRWIQALRDRVRTDPKLPLLHVDLADALMSNAQWTDAVESLEAATRLERNADFYRKLAHCYENLQNVPGRLGALGSIADLRPTDAAAHFEYGMARLRAGHWEAAHDALGIALKLSPSLAAAVVPYRDATLALAREHLERKDDASALRYYRILAAMPECPFELLVEHATCAQRLDEVDDAVRTLSRALALRPGDEPVTLHYASLLVQAGQVGAAIDACRIAAERHPTSADLFQRLGALYSGQRLFAPSIDALKRAISLEPQHPSRYYLLAKVLIEATQEQEAVQWLEAGLRIHYDDPSLMGLLGWCAQRADATADHRRALTLYQQLLSLGRPTSFSLRGLANALVMIGQHHLAGPYYEQAVSLDPRNAQLRFEIGSLYAMHRRLDEAKRHWHELRSLDPNLAIRLAQVLGE